eukprot:c13450_g1_i1.p1 GENE.c13450_g1_i1~~c13450_g1_i1.p1  ORF type:complete len:357 (+),score=67.65 c13450_g1_i1:30-1073(+)
MADSLGDPIALAHGAVGAWAALPRDALGCEVIRGGLTNVLNRVFVASAAAASTLPTDAPREVLLRQFGLGTEDLIDRAREAVVFKTLSDAGVGPKLHGVFDGGRAEEFLHGETFVTSELSLPQYAPAIAAQVALLHMATPAIERANTFDAGMGKWWRLAATSVMRTPETALKARQFDLAVLHAEMGWLLGALAATASPVVFTHNDLLAGNVMRLGDGRIMLVDFEYGCYSYRGFDFGNHFAEMGIHYNVEGYPGFFIHPDHYPSETLQDLFFSSYLRTLGTAESEWPAAIAALKAEAKAFALASHFQWALWGIVQAARSTIAFGFLEFAAARFDQYYALKRKWFAAP